MSNTRPPAPPANPTRAAHGFQRLIAGMAVTLTWACGAVAEPATAPTSSAAPLGDFEARADVGKVEKPGSAAFDAPAGRYRVTGSGENLWKTQDAFHFVYRKVSGDVTFSAEVRLGEGVSNHRKAGLMLRQGLEADAPYVDVMVHGDGLIALQYRTERGGVTAGTASTIKAPAVVRLERRGDTFTLLVAPASEKDPKADPAGKPDPADRFKATASVTLALEDPVYAGLAVCSHDPATSVTADFAAVALKEEPQEKGKGEKAADPNARRPVPDEGSLQGTWLVVRKVKDGRQEKLADPPRSMTFSGESVTSDGGGGKRGKGTFKVDATTTPRRITLAATKGPYAGRAFEAIYELKGHTLQLAYGTGDNAATPPKDFAGGRGEAAEVLERRQP